MTTATVITHHGHEPFTAATLHDSIIAACLAVRSSEGSADIAARAVVAAVTIWLDKHPEVTSNDIRHIAAKTLRTHNPEAAYFYAHHKHII